MSIRDDLESVHRILAKANGRLAMALSQKKLSRALIPELRSVLELEIERLRAIEKEIGSAS